jgi:hypothetical protein
MLSASDVSTSFEKGFKNDKDFEFEEYMANAAASYRNNNFIKFQSGCFNCGEAGHSWRNCGVMVDNCFICREKFTSRVNYHNPVNCTKFNKQQSEVKKKVEPNFLVKRKMAIEDNTPKKLINIGRETNIGSQQSSVKGKDFSRTFSTKTGGMAQDFSRPFTPKTGGMALNANTSVWEYRPPMIELTAKYASTSELQNSEDDRDSDNEHEGQNNFEN